MGRMSATKALSTNEIHAGKSRALWRWVTRTATSHKDSIAACLRILDSFVGRKGMS